MNFKGCDIMDFLRLSKEFQNLQKKLEESTKFDKNIKDYIKKLEKEIVKYEQRNETEKDIMQKSINNLLIEIKKDFKSNLEKIININNKG